MNIQQIHDLHDLKDELTNRLNISRTIQERCLASLQPLPSRVVRRIPKLELQIEALAQAIQEASLTVIR